MNQTGREQLARENRIAKIEEETIRSKMEQEAQLIPKSAIITFLEKARENARSPFYFDGKWAYRLKPQFERVFYGGALVLEVEKE